MSRTKFQPLRFAKLLLGICVVHMTMVLALATAIYSEPTQNALLIPRPEGVFIVGENDYNLTRIKFFASLKEAQVYMNKFGWKVPALSVVHLRPATRAAKFISANRVSWVNAGDNTKYASILETHDAQTANQMHQWVESGNLQHSRLGFAVRLEIQE